MLRSGVVLALALAPGAVRQATHDEYAVGPFRFEQVSKLEWPGVYVPDFELAAEPRWVHRFSLGFAGRLRVLTFDAVTVEPPAADDRSNGLVPSARAFATVWLGASVSHPRRPLRVSMGQLWYAGAQAVARGVTPLKAAVPKLVVSGRM